MRGATQKRGPPEPPLQYNNPKEDIQSEECSEAHVTWSRCWWEQSGTAMEAAKEVQIATAQVWKIWIHNGMTSHRIISYWEAKLFGLWIPYYPLPVHGLVRHAFTAPSSAYPKNLFAGGPGLFGDDAVRSDTSRGPVVSALKH